MRIRRLSAIAAIAGAALLLSGCVWLRLLSLKDQFADFDRWIDVPDAPGIELRFRHPELYGDDLDTLIKATPTATAVAPTNPGLTVRSYAFTHVASPEGADPASAERVLVLTAGVQAERVVFVGMPDEIFRVIPRDLALRAMRSLGRAQVDRGNRSATAAVDLAGIATPLPTGDALVALFGRPNHISERDGRLRVLWRYELAGTSLRDDGQPVIAAMAFCFAPGSAYGQQRPNRFQVNVSGLWLYLDLPAVPPPTVHAAPLLPPAGAAPDPQAGHPPAR